MFDSFWLQLYLISKHSIPQARSTLPLFTCSKLKIEILEQVVKCVQSLQAPERRIVDFEHISYLVLMFLLLNLNMQLPAGKRTLYSYIPKPWNGIA